MCYEIRANGVQLINVDTHKKQKAKWNLSLFFFLHLSYLLSCLIFVKKITSVGFWWWCGLCEEWTHTKEKNTGKTFHEIMNQLLVGERWSLRLWSSPALSCRDNVEPNHSQSEQLNFKIWPNMEFSDFSFLLLSCLAQNSHKKRFNYLIGNKWTIIASIVQWIKTKFYFFLQILTFSSFHFRLYRIPVVAVDVTTTTNDQ